MPVNSGQEPLEAGDELPMASHAPTEISGNSELATLATSGNGTYADPYIIEGWDINASGFENALKISDTYAHLVIRNCNLSYANVGTHQRCGLYLDNVWNVTVENVTAYENYHNGFKLRDCVNITITGCTLIDNGNPSSVGTEGNGMTVHSCINVLIEETNFVDNERQGLIFTTQYSVNSFNITVRNCDFSGSMTLMDSFQNFMNNFTFENCTISNFSYAGFYIQGYDTTRQSNWVIRNVTIENFDAYSTLGALILRDVTGALLEGIEIRNIDNGHDEGTLDLGSADNTTITDCWFHDILGTMIQTSYWSYNCQNITIKDSIITNCTPRGIWIDSGSVDISISNVTIDDIGGTGPYGRGIHIAIAHDIVIQECDINNATQYGIYLDSNSHDLDVMDCSISNSEDHGVYLCSNTNNVTIANNSFTDNNGATGTYDAGHIQARDEGNGNLWNDSLGGNKWSDWLYPDTNHDGFVDNPYLIDGAVGAYDQLPLAGPEIEPPEIRIDSPSEDEVLYSTFVDIEWSAWDNESGLNHFEVQIDDGSWDDVGLVNNYTTILAQGPHNAKVKAIDNVSNEATAQVNFTITILTPPGAPQNLEATFGDSSISLEWDPPASDGGTPITGYKVYRGPSTGTLSFLKNVTETSTEDCGLTNGQTYFYAVSAVNSEGEGVQSSEVNATPGRTPDGPTVFTAIPGYSNITLDWDVPDDGGYPILHYKVFRGQTSGEETSLDNVTTDSYVDESVDVATNYFYIVKAVNALGDGMPSDEVSAIILVVPGAPTNLSGVVTLDGINLTWDAPTFDGGSSIIGYKIYKGTESGNLTWLVNCTGLEYSDEDVTAGVAYYYSIIAYNAVGDGPASDEGNVTFTTTPSEPRDIQATAGNAQVNLTWTAPSSDGGLSIDQYRVYSGTSQGSLTLLATTLGTSYTATGLTNGQTYYFKVSAVNDDGEGEFSDMVNATPVTVPSPPSDPSASGGSGGITLTWTAPSDGGSTITGYKVYKSTSSGSETYLTTVTSTTYLDSDVEDGTEYFYVIKAVNAEGDSLDSTEISASMNADSGSDAWLWALLIIPIAAILFGIWFLLGKKKKDKDEEEEKVE